MGIADHFHESLSDDQINSINRIETFLSSEVNCFLLKGYAGTGKTYLMEGLVKYFKSISRSYSILTPTGRAAMVIGAKTKSTAVTIHKGIYNLGDFEDDEHTFKFRYNLYVNSDPENSVYIVDEASMISDSYNEDEFFLFGTGYLLRDLFSFVDFKYRVGRKVIFIGDNAQLPPIGMSFSPALNKEYLVKAFSVTVDEYEMTHIKRQEEGSGILNIATNLRESLERNQFNRFEISTFSDVMNLTDGDFSKIYFHTVGNKISDNTIVISHSNKQAHEFNTLIRQEFFPNELDVQQGDILINTKNNYNYLVELYNGQFLKVVEVSDTPELPRTVRFYKKGGEKVEVIFIFRDIVVELKDVKGIPHTIRCKILDNFLKSDSPRLTQSEQQGLYVDFKIRHPELKPRTQEFKNALRTDVYFNAIQVKYGYAITCHKAQGGEWQNAFLDFQVYMKILSKGFFRWAYTGITRARKNLFALHVHDYSPLSEFVIQPISVSPNVPPNQFYVPEDYFSREIELEFARPFLKAKYIELQEKFNKQDIEITVSHLQYVERYSFSRAGKSTTIDLTYRNSGFTGVSRVISGDDAEFTDFVKTRIVAPLIFEFEYDPPEEFQKKLYDFLKEKTFEEGVQITNIVNEQHCDKYFLMTGLNYSVLDCYFNGKGIYTVIRPFSSIGEADIELQSLIKTLC